MEPLDGRLFGQGQPCFGCAPDHPVGFRLTFEREADAVVTRFVPGPRYQGPPGIMHGGLVLTLADEIAAWALIGALERFGFTTKVDGRLKRAVRIGEEVVGHARVVAPPSRIADVSVIITQGGEPCFEGQFRFALLGREAAEKLLGGPLPDAWQRFART